MENVYKGQIVMKDINNRQRMTNDELIEILKIAIESEQSLRGEGQSSINTYTQTIIYVIGGALAGFRILSGLGYLPGIFAFVAGVIIIVLSISGYFYYESMFRRQVEYMTIEAKIEDYLGLTDRCLYHSSQYWDKECIIPNNYIRTRVDNKSSDIFISTIMKQKMKNIRIYYATFASIGIAMLLIGGGTIQGIINIGLIK